MKVNFAPRTIEEEIEQNISCIIETMAGTVPLDRSFGLESSDIDTAETFFQSQMTNKIISAIQDFEPRAIVTEVMFSQGVDGKMKPTVKYSIMAEEG